jgi:hypothetical protein
VQPAAAKARAMAAPTPDPAPVIQTVHPAMSTVIPQPPSPRARFRIAAALTRRRRLASG